MNYLIELINCVYVYFFEYVFIWVVCFCFNFDLLIVYILLKLKLVFVLNKFNFCLLFYLDECLILFLYGWDRFRKYVFNI